MNTRVLITTSVFLLCLGCGNKPALNINALDLDRYIHDFSASTHKFPAYVELMKPEHCKPLEDLSIPDSPVTLLDAHLKPIYPAIACEVKSMHSYFEAKDATARLYLIGEAGSEAEVRFQALAASSKSNRYVQLKLKTLLDDSRAQAWTPEEELAVLKATLNKNNRDTTVYFVDDVSLMKSSLEPFSGYKTIFNLSSAVSRKVLFNQTRASKPGSVLRLKTPSVPELLLHLRILSPVSTQHDLQTIASMLSALLPNSPFYALASKILASEDLSNALKHEIWLNHEPTDYDHLEAQMRDFESTVANGNIFDVDSLAKRVRKFHMSSDSARLEQHLSDIESVLEEHMRSFENMETDFNNYKSGTGRI